MDGQYYPIWSDFDPPGITGEFVQDLLHQEISINLRHPVIGTGELTPVGTPEAAKYIRQAISCCIPRQTIVDDILNGSATPATVPIPEGCEDLRYFMDNHWYNTESNEFIFIGLPPNRHAVWSLEKNWWDWDIELVMEDVVEVMEDEEEIELSAEDVEDISFQEYPEAEIIETDEPILPLAAEDSEEEITAVEDIQEGGDTSEFEEGMEELLEGPLEMEQDSSLDELLEEGELEDLEDLATGKYFIKSWHEKLKTQKKAITISEDGDVTVQLDLKRGVPSVLYK